MDDIEVQRSFLRCFDSFASAAFTKKAKESDSWLTNRTKSKSKVCSSTRGYQQEQAKRRGLGASLRLGRQRCWKTHRKEIQ